ncbi:Putative UDP-rhamnose:rhamnosyltransferase 1 [Linum perenne]
MLPLHVVDQGLIARVFTEKEVRFEILRKEEDGGFSRGDVAETMRKVVAEEEGQRYRDRANTKFSPGVAATTEKLVGCENGLV